MIAVPQGGVPEAERHHRFIIIINTVPGKYWIVKGDTLCRKVVCVVYAFYQLHIHLKDIQKSIQKHIGVFLHITSPISFRPKIDHH